MKVEIIAANRIEEIYGEMSTIMSRNPAYNNDPNTLVRMTSQFNELVKRVGNDSLDGHKVRAGMQRLVEGDFAPAPLPKWYGMLPEAQLWQMKRLNAVHNWGFAPEDFPAVPKKVDLKENQVLCLRAYLPEGLNATVRTVLKLIAAQRADYSQSGLNEDTHIHQPRTLCKAGLRWVVIDVRANLDQSPMPAVVNSSNASKVADVELLWLLYFQPQWTEWWGQLPDMKIWSAGLAVDLSHRVLFTATPGNKDGHTFEIGLSDAHRYPTMCVAPTVREL